MCIVYVRDAQKFGGSTAPRTVFFVLGGIGLCSLHVSGLGGKSGRRGGSKRKKKHISPHMPPQALFPQHPPSSDSTHTPQTHPHLPHLPECSRKGRECSRKGSTQQQSAVTGSELWNSRCGIFCRQWVKQWPIGCVRSGDLSATGSLFTTVAGGGDSVGQLIYCSLAILRVSSNFFSHPDLFALCFSCFIARIIE